MTTGHIILIGMPASAKSRVGRELAAALNQPLIDIDQEIVKSQNCSITEIFAREDDSKSGADSNENGGEVYFRGLETDQIKHALQAKEPSIISFGGGSVANSFTGDVNRELVLNARKNGSFVVYLDVSYAVAEKRITNPDKINTRPIFLEKGVEYWQTLQQERHLQYLKCADLRIKTGYNNGEIVESTDVVAQIKSAINSRRIHIGNDNELRYTVSIGSGLFASIASKISNLNSVLRPKVAILHTKSVTNYAEQIADVLTNNELEYTFYEVPDGENGKTGTSYLNCLESLAENAFTRTDFIVAIGGGALTDFAGFVAATYLRGIKYINVPTSLLAMVDASVGGKTAINLQAGKNLCGAFYEPEAVYCDTAVLATLPTEYTTEAYGEIVKMGLTFDQAILDDLSLNNVICRCVAEKAKVVSSDLKEAGQREFLNYGHTFGHIIEKLENYTWKHGNAVSVGMIFAAHLACELGLIDTELVDYHYTMLKACGLPTTWTPSNATKGDALLDEIINLMQTDKKSRSGNLRFVLLEGLQKPTIVENPPLNAIKSALREVIL